MSFSSFSQEGVTTKGNSLTIREIPPVWPGCEDDAAGSQQCFLNKMSLHVKENYKYPRDSKGKVVRGASTVTFYIDEQGMVSKVTAKGENKAINHEAVRIVKLLPEMKPGHRGGKPVPIKYTMPFKF